MKDSSKIFCSILFDVLSRHGVKHVVCSPGSRNVPLLLAVASRQELTKHFVVDERSAAYMGLGLSLLTKTPVAIVCTSGTALLNFAPAVAEAYYQNIPLIVISADRPVQWIDQDDSQTLRQDDALSNFVKNSYSIPAIGEEEKEMRWYVNRIVNDAVLTALSPKKGPVHINVHLSEPLGNKIDRQFIPPRLIDVIEADSIGNKEIIRNFVRELSQSKVLFVAGFNQPDANLQKEVVRFTKFPNVTLMAETISNLHLNQQDYSIDSTLTAYDDETLDSLAPDIVISIGGSLVSRKLKEYLRRNSKKIKHWSIGYSHTTSDPFMSLSMKLETDPVRFLRSVNSVLGRCQVSPLVSNYKEKWNYLRFIALETKQTFIHSCDWSELKAFNSLLKSLPSNYNLFLSNGTAIRYAQIINYSLPHASFCNRGVSGIDGSLSTAIGAAMTYKGPTLLVTGDLSLAYDIGALGLKEIPDSLKIIVIDNQGGGIFRFISSTSSLEEREQYLCQSPLLPLKHLAEGYGWEYWECNDEVSLINLLTPFFESPVKSILKIYCPGIESAEILKNYMKIKVIKYEGLENN